MALCVVILLSYELNTEYVVLYFGAYIGRTNPETKHGSHEDQNRVLKSG